MQLLGKNYFGPEKENALPAKDNADNAYSEEGLDALCAAVEASGKSRLPAWLQKTGTFFRENKKHVIVAASVTVIGFAVYLNWTLYREPASSEQYSALPGADAGVTAVLAICTIGAGAARTVRKKEEDSGNDGGIREDDYFAVSRINRQRARDEAIEVLQTVADGAENLTDVRDDALAGIARIAKDIESEAAIESLVRGKGFEACVAVISGDSANVIVKTASLLPNEVAQIQEIVYETAGILPANVKIIEK
ncbi:MAG: SpoIIIAH-like family protein [Clostridia bacterium]|nr:SpoIIIAH-like family protein [Clostridia bacterium]